MVAASRLKLARVSAGLTQFDVYVRTGIQPGRLSMLERGLVAPRDVESAALARALGGGVLDAAVPPPAGSSTSADSAA